MNQRNNPLLLIISLFVYLLIYFPIIVIIVLSFNNSSVETVFTQFGFDQYKGIVEDTRLLEAIKNTLFIAFTSTIVATVMGTITAIGIHSLNKKLRIRMMVLNNIPVINPDIVTGISLMLVFSLLPITFGMNTILLAHIFFSIPFVVLTVLPKLKELDENMYDAAQDLGCNMFQAIYKVIIPSIKTGIIGGALIAFTMSIDDFVISYFTTGSGVQNVSIWIYSRLGRRTFNPAVYAYNSLVTIIAIITLAVINIFNKKDKKIKAV